VAKHKWPPCFCDKHAGDYVLDSRSGMFYHNDTDFFYDATSRLYYSNKQKLYFRLEEGPMRQFVSLQTDGQSSQSTSEPEGLFSRKERSGSKAIIAINLKTKKLAARKSQVIKHPPRDSLGSHSTESSSTASLPKLQAAYINKWRARQQEPDIPSASELLTTKTGEPICLICKRKFKNPEQLVRHEKESQLHQDNILRLDTAEKRKTPYVDRSRIRRDMYGEGPCSSVLGPSALPTIGDTLEVVTSLPADTDQHLFDPLGSQNVGRKILQEMGWTKDKSDQTEQTHQRLTQEWDRIESNMTSTRQSESSRR
jgi:hypothetical protein